VARSQIFNQVKAMPDPGLIMGPFDEAIADFVAGRPMNIDPSFPEGLRMLLLALENPTNLPFSRELWDYDLAENLRDVREPVLVLIGKKDLQIDWMIDGERLEQAAAQSPTVSFAYPENADHVLKHETTPIEELTPQAAALHYNAADSVLDGEAVDAIIEWFQRRMPRD
jgi:hypothetical protein